MFRGEERVSLYIEGEGELTRKICLVAGRKEKFLRQKQAVCLEEGLYDEMARTSQ